MHKRTLELELHEPSELLASDDTVSVCYTNLGHTDLISVVHMISLMAAALPITQHAHATN